MKTIIKFSVFTLIFAALFLACWTFAVQPAHAKKYVLKAASSIPEASPYHQGFLFFSDLVEKRTNGGIKIQQFPMESLVKATDTLESLAKGIIDLGFISFAYWPGDLPFNSDSQFLPFAVTWDKMADVLEAGKEMWQKELDKFDQSLLLYQPNCGHFYFKKDVVDLANPSFKGLRVSAVGSLSDVTELLAGAPVNMPASELPSGIRTGTIDGMFTAHEAYVNFELVDDAPYVYEYGSSFCFMGIWWAINKNAWNKLPAEYQQIIIDAADESNDHYIQLVQDSNKTDLEKAIKMGANIKYITPEQMKVWKTKMDPFYANLIKKHGKKMQDWIDTVEGIVEK